MYYAFANSIVLLPRRLMNEMHLIQCSLPYTVFLRSCNLNLFNNVGKELLKKYKFLLCII